jgi:hypothetical protein
VDEEIRQEFHFVEACFVELNAIFGLIGELDMPSTQRIIDGKQLGFCLLLAYIVS